MMIFSLEEPDDIGAVSISDGRHVQTDEVWQLGQDVVAIVLGVLHWVAVQCKLAQCAHTRQLVYLCHVINTVTMEIEYVKMWKLTQTLMNASELIE